MYAIYLKTRKDPIVVDDHTGERLKQAWGNNQLPAVVMLDDVSFEKTQLKSIEKNYRPDLTDQNSEAARKHGVEYVQELRDDYRAKRAGLLKLPPQERGKLMGLPELVWWANTGFRDIPQAIAEQIVARQVAFFEQYPTHTLANPTCYRDIIQPHFRKVDSHMTLGAMAFIERAIATDAYYS